MQKTRAPKLGPTKRRSKRYSRTPIHRAPIYRVPRFTGPDPFLPKSSFMCKSKRMLPRFTVPELLPPRGPVNRGSTVLRTTKLQQNSGFSLVFVLLLLLPCIISLISLTYLTSNHVVFISDLPLSHRRSVSTNLLGDSHSTFLFQMK